MTASDLLKYGPGVACVMGYALARFEHPTFMSAKALAEELGVHHSIVRRGLNILIADGKLRRERVSVSPHEHGGATGKSRYQARPIWGWKE